MKQAVLRHKTRLHSELQKLKIKRGVRSNAELAQTGDERAGKIKFEISALIRTRATTNVYHFITAWIPRYVRVNMAIPDWTTDQAVQAFAARGFELSDPFQSRSVKARGEMSIV